MSIKSTCILPYNPHTTKSDEMEDESILSILQEKMRNKDYATWKKAEHGVSSVFYPKEAPSLVVKDYSNCNLHHIERAELTEEVREIINNLGFQNSLVVPKNKHLFSACYVEERLPISSDMLVNMGNYINHQKAFDQAVSGLVELFAKGRLFDIIRLSSSWDKVLGIQYENIPLYLDQAGGKVGLIDLECFAFEPKVDGILDLIMLFPFHAEAIAKQAKAKNIELKQESIENAKQKGEAYLQFHYINHKEHIKRFPHPSPLNLTEAVEESIIMKNLQDIEDHCNDIPCINSFTLTEQKTIQSFFIRSAIKYLKINTEQNTSIKNRKINQSIHNIIDGTNKIIANSSHESSNERKFSKLLDPKNISLREFLTKIITNLLTGLKEEKQIADYDVYYGYFTILF